MARILGFTKKDLLRPLKKLDTFVIQDMYGNTVTSDMADIVFPAAGWGEKEGIFINSERRIGIVRKVRKAPGQALSDFNIFKLLAHYWGCGEMFKDWDSPESVFQILKSLTKGQPCDITGIKDYEMIEELSGIQWPFTEEYAKQEYTPERRLFEDGKFYTKDQRANFMFEAHRPIPEAPDAEYPFALLTGRGTSSQWHTQTRTSKSDVLRKLYPEKIYAEINQADAEKMGIKPNDSVKIISRRGEITVTCPPLSYCAAGAVVCADALPRGQYFDACRF